MERVSCETQAFFSRTLSSAHDGITSLNPSFSKRPIRSAGAKSEKEGACSFLLKLPKKDKVQFDSQLC